MMEWNLKPTERARLEARLTLISAKIDNADDAANALAAEHAAAQRIAASLRQDRDDVRRQLAALDPFWEAAA